MDAARREHRRHRMGTDCEVWLGDELVADRALDVSPSGMRVRSIREVSIGDRVSISLRLPGSDVWVDLEGEVARRIEGRRESDEGRSFGVQFRRPTRSQARLLASVACWYPESAGGRGLARDPSAAKKRGA